MRHLLLLSLAFFLLAGCNPFSDSNSENKEQSVTETSKAADKVSPDTSSLDIEQKLIPHKAIYQVSMVGVKSSSQILDVHGEMFYEWTPTCEGWITNHSFQLVYSYVDIGTVTLKSDFSTYESKDRKSFSFSAQRKRDDEVYESFRGKAEVDAAGKINVVYTDPPLEMDFDAAILFPVAHTFELLENSIEGNRFYNAIVFDGSDDTGPYEINTFFGEKAPYSEDKYKDVKEVDSGLLKGNVQKMRLAFFPYLKAETNSPEYEMSMDMHDNGIVSEMRVEYPEFTVKQALKALEVLPAPTGCGEGK